MRPAFLFGKRRTCYPSAALDAAGRQHGSNPAKWPDAAGNSCPDPGPPGQGTPFPTYWLVKRCAHDEVRVVYSLYFEHDGFANVLVARGHMHDWERIVVIWRRDGSTGEWTRSRLLKSMHSGYQSRAWGSIESTFDYSDPSEFRGKNKDGAKIYSGWAKHPFFDTKDTGWRDSISQGCQREYRDGTWWYLPSEQDMVWAAIESPEGSRMAALDWGSATGGPWRVEEDICDKSDGGFVPC
ncbi:hypothetical protein FN846DRAFT_779326 [Sphaerosporella brunnea]|uniref:Uncharacterized protein n=1 Tax=Sphaerosporella brunnea TaxID=1250544 RepID=A0A5J5EVY1_9PEZI|nr:hypothetical protein FN846DRAFT_779326 [Sphaerosporella brunnea]